MKNKARIGVEMKANIETGRGAKPRFMVSSHWNFEQWRGGKKIDEWENDNLCTDQGLNRLLDAMFHGSTQDGTWYIALFNTNTTPLVGHTYATPGYTESGNYDEATRQAFVEAAASSKSMTNSANKASFTMSASETIYGAALVNVSTKSDTAAGDGILFCSSLFSASKAVEDDDVLKVTVTLTGADT